MHPHTHTSFVHTQHEHTRTHIHAHVYTHTHMHAHTHTHTHTHTHATQTLVKCKNQLPDFGLDSTKPIQALYLHTIRLNKLQTLVNNNGNLPTG